MSENSIEKMTITIEDAAQMLGISRKTAYTKLVKMDGFPVIHIGKRMVILKDSFLQWLEKQKVLQQ